MGSIFGQTFRIATWGESHGGGVGVTIEGVPPMIPLSEEDVQVELDRRRPGQSKIVTPRQEADACEILSGVFEGRTTGTPIAILVRNTDARPEAYTEMATTYRPSHADYTYDAKYGFRAWHGGGRSSARETIGRVAAGVVAAKTVQQFFPKVEVLAWVDAVQAIQAEVSSSEVSREAVESNMVRCPDAAVAEKMIALIESMRKEGNSVGGVVRAVVRGLPPGLGDPVFDKLEADFAKGLMSLPASKGFEVGSGFAGTLMTGLEHNDVFVPREDGTIGTETNRSGGIQGGISNGEPIELRVAFKPVATVLREQQTVDDQGKATTLAARGRHDPCVLPRAVPMVEAMIWLVLADHLLRQRAQCGLPAS
ncbi:MAG: chorismate synthase [Verrucomicrobiales bacterium]